MCGILGGNNSKWDYEKALLSIKHRGPDGQRITKFSDIVLGFARLSIIDLSDRGMQPMFSTNEDICIVFNGEIYGYKKIREKLENLGYFFKSTADTEVIINLYLEYGDKFIDYIDGMYSIALYDRRINKIKLYRDRAGIKPLYYYYSDNKFAFSSELEAIVYMCNNVKFEIDYTAVYDYITYTYIPEPKTLYKNVYKLDKGNVLVFDVKKSRIERIERYWEVIPNTQQASINHKDDIAEKLRFLIDKSIGEQMVADVPVGSFLSGGIDSSIVTLGALKYNPNIETFSIGFTDKKYDELKYADIMSDKFSIKKNQQILDMKSFKDLYFRLKDWYGEPYCDKSAFPTYLVSKIAKEKVTVVLTGDGGDELFGGYLRYKAFIENNMDKGLNSRFITNIYEQLYTFLEFDKFNIVDNLLMESVAKLCTLYGYEQKRMKSKFAKAWGIDSNYDDYWYLRKYFIKDLPPITRLQYMDFNTYLPSDVLAKVDRVSMRVSLETRIPLLSRELMEFAFGLPENDRCPNGELKGLLKYAYKDILPKEIINRKKMGFGIPEYFVKGKVSHQETILKDIWGIGV